MKLLLGKTNITTWLVLTVITAGLFSCRKESISVKTPGKDTSVTIHTKEFHQLGVLPDNPTLLERVGYYKRDISMKTVLPARVDFSDKMPPVGSQGGQNSCVGWAVGYYLKSYHEVVERKWKASENTYSPSWIYNQINGGRDEGSSLGDAMSLMVNYGCDFTDNFAYSPTNFTKQPDAGSVNNAKFYKASGWNYVARTTDEVKAILASYKPVVFAIPVYPDFRRLKEGNEVYDDWSGMSDGNHAICIVGYDDAKQAFKFINSHGTDYGLQGYGWIAYSKTASVLAAYVLTDKPNTYISNCITGDFNGDKKSDIFHANGYGWYVSWSGAGGFKRINTSTVGIGSLKAGDFNGDGKTDILSANGTEWKISYSGSGSWTTAKTSAITADYMVVGDFNGDKKSDILYANGIDWKVSYSATGPWTLLKNIGHNCLIYGNR